MSNNDGERVREQEQEVEPPTFVNAETNREDVTIWISVDGEEFREAVRREVNLELERQLRNPPSALLDLVAKYIESWLANRRNRGRDD